MVLLQPSNLRVAGSNPVSRFLKITNPLPCDQTNKIFPDKYYSAFGDSLSLGRSEHLSGRGKIRHNLVSQTGFCESTHRPRGHGGLILPSGVKRRVGRAKRAPPPPLSFLTQRSSKVGSKRSPTFPRSNTKIIWIFSRDRIERVSISIMISIINGYVTERSGM